MSDTNKRPDIVAFFASQGPNVMTPRPLRYYETDSLMIELSYGKGIFDADLFGVTVFGVLKGTPVYDSDLSQLCFSKQEAEMYVRKVIEEKGL